MELTTSPTFDPQRFDLSVRKKGTEAIYSDLILGPHFGRVAALLNKVLQFVLARKAGSVYLDSKFGEGKVSAVLKVFKRWGTGTLVASTAIPFPFPTSMFFAAAGASNYHTSKYLAVITLSRAARYTAIAIAADLYGRHFIRVLQHPTQYWGWLLLFVAMVSA